MSRTSEVVSLFACQQNLNVFTDVVFTSVGTTRGQGIIRVDVASILTFSFFGGFLKYIIPKYWPIELSIVSI